MRDYEKELCRGIWGREFTKKDLEIAFAIIQSKKDWKAEVDASILVKDYELAATAVEFFTATPLKIGGVDRLNSMLIVHADGYAAGPAGDH